MHIMSFKGRFNKSRKFEYAFGGWQGDYMRKMEVYQN